MREIHGIAGVNRVNTSNTTSTIQNVRVADGIGEVIIHHTSTDAAGLTTEEARFIAKMLMEAADRVEKADAKPV